MTAENDSIFMGGNDRITTTQEETLPESPGYASQHAKSTWNKLGTLSLYEIIANSQVEIDKKLQFGISKEN